MRRTFLRTACSAFNAKDTAKPPHSLMAAFKSCRARPVSTTTFKRPLPFSIADQLGHLGRREHLGPQHFLENREKRRSSAISAAATALHPAPAPSIIYLIFFHQAANA